MARRKKSSGGKKGSGGGGLYTLAVSLLEGPVTEAFAKANPRLSRTIEIRGSQTLEALHNAIFEAYDRFDEHMYEFQFGRRMHDPEGKRYVLPMAMDDAFGGGPEIAGDVTRTTIGSLGLEVGQCFGYWFDFGDDWYHQIDVVATDPQAPPGDYPRVTKRVGDSPPQYLDWDEEEEDWEDDEDWEDEEEDADE
jgi:hypothetical protein